MEYVDTWYDEFTGPMALADITSQKSVYTWALESVDGKLRGAIQELHEEDYQDYPSIKEYKRTPEIKNTKDCMVVFLNSTRRLSLPYVRSQVIIQRCEDLEKAFEDAELAERNEINNTTSRSTATVMITLFNNNSFEQCKISAVNPTGLVNLLLLHKSLVFKNEDTISVLKKYSIESSTGDLSRLTLINQENPYLAFITTKFPNYSTFTNWKIDESTRDDIIKHGNKSILEIRCTTVLRKYATAMYVERYNRVKYGDVSKLPSNIVIQFTKYVKVCEVVVTDIEVEWGTEWGTENVICENKQSTEINKEKRYPSSNSITTSSRDSDTLNKPVNYVISESYYEEFCGNLTSNYAKKYLYIKFDKKQKPKKKNWILLSSYKDESLVRGESVLSITHEIYNVEDYYVSDIRYVEVGIEDVELKRSGIGDEQIAISSYVKNSSLKLNSQ
ncbi:hypothetical protein H8356DRAFT_1347745 [Neocallimastix lanati (nom. inval.)]|nr:hypothetical protein H8356DRAFT_1347745 [Neocallimastix sp. JGI-2020a]